MMTTNSAPQTYLLENTDENHPHADVRFKGSLISYVSSRRGERSTRWCEIKIFRTVGERYVVQTIGCSADPDEEPISRLTICPDEAAVRAAGGLRWLGRAALDEAGITTVIEVA